MKIIKVGLITALVLFLASAAADQTGAASEKPAAIVVKAPVVYLVKVTGSVEIAHSENSSSSRVIITSRKSKLPSQSRVSVTEGDAVLVAGKLKLYLKKGDRVHIISDRKIVRPSITVGKNYFRTVTVSSGHLKHAVKPSGVIFAP